MSRSKGIHYEREIVRLHEELGVPASRVPLSGASPGYPGDVKIGDLIGEVKMRRNGKGFSTLEDWLGGKDVLFLRRHRSEPLVVLPWRTYAALIVSYAGRPRESRGEDSRD